MRIVDTLPEEAFDSLVKGLSELLDVPVVLVSLIEEHRQWFKAKVGLQICETSRDIAFCAHAILQPDPLIVEDATQDYRFKDNELVTGDFHLRSYAGVPIVVNEQRLGTLCCLDFSPRKFNEKEIRGLIAMAKQVEILLESRRLTEELAESQDLFLSALHSMHDGLVLKSATGEVIIANQRACEILGLNQSELRARTSLDPKWGSIYEDGTPWHGKDHPSMVALATGKIQTNKIMGLRKPDGTLSWVKVNSHPLFKADSKTPFCVVSTFSDLTSERLNQKRISSQLDQIREYARLLELRNVEVVRSNIELQGVVQTDFLTGISNNRAFHNRLDKEFAKCEKQKAICSILLIDVDNFKQFNDEFGHQIGDEVLKQVATYLNESSRKDELVARYGGEEFMILLPEAGQEEALQTAERLRHIVELGEWKYRDVTASFGVATLNPGTTSQQLIKQADDALYASKRSGRNRVTHFEQMEEIYGYAKAG